jgi:hypothetical protein
MITETRHRPLSLAGRRPAKRCFIDLAVHPHFASDSAFFASQGRKLYFFTTLYVDVKERAGGSSRVAASARRTRPGGALFSLRQRSATPAPRAVDAWVFRVSLYGLQLARKMVFKFTKIAAPDTDGTDSTDRRTCARSPCLLVSCSSEQAGSSRPVPHHCHLPRPRPRWA